MIHIFPVSQIKTIINKNKTTISMSIIYFIQDNTLLLGAGIVVVVLLLAVLASNSKKTKPLYPPLEVEVSEPVQDISTAVVEEILEKSNVTTVEKVTKETEQQVKEIVITPMIEAKNWWKSLSIHDKKLYAFDGQFGDRKLSTLKSSEILLIYNTFTENNQITTK